MKEEEIEGENGRVEIGKRIWSRMLILRKTTRRRMIAIISWEACAMLKMVWSKSHQCLLSLFWINGNVYPCSVILIQRPSLFVTSLTVPDWRFVSDTGMFTPHHCQRLLHKYIPSTGRHTMISIGCPGSASSGIPRSKLVKSGALFQYKNLSRVFRLLTDTGRFILCPCSWCDGFFALC